MRVTFDRAEYIRARAEALRKPAPAKVPRVKAPRIKVYRTDRCSCGRIPIGARGKCEGCKAWARAARARNVAAGLCAHAASHGPAVAGGKHCARCREFYRQQTAKRAAKAKARRKEST